MKKNKILLYLYGKMFKNVSPDSVQSGRTCPANLGVGSSPVRKLIYPVIRHMSNCHEKFDCAAYGTESLFSFVFFRFVIRLVDHDILISALSNSHSCPPAL